MQVPTGVPMGGRHHGVPPDRPDLRLLPHELRGGGHVVGPREGRAPAQQHGRLPDPRAVRGGLPGQPGSGQEPAAPRARPTSLPSQRALGHRPLRHLSGQARDARFLRL